MKFKASPVTSLEDATIDFEQAQVFLTGGDITSDSTGSLARITKLNGTAIPLKTAAWTAPTFTGTWANNGGGFEAAGYLKDPLGFVHLKGLVVGGVTGTSAFTLPAGFRPGAITANAYTSNAVQISTAGAVTIFWAGSSQTGLSGITFLAEN